MMTKKEKIDCIITALRQEVEHAHVQYVNAEAAWSAAKAGDEAWKRETERDHCSFRTSGYDPAKRKSQRDERMRIFERTKEVLEFAIDTFLSMIEETQNNDE